MISFRKSALFAVVVLVASIAGTAASQETYEAKVVHEYRYYSDGTSDVVVKEWNDRLGRFVKVSPRARVSADGKRSFPSAVLERINRWRNAKKIGYDFSEEAIKFRKDAKKIMNKYVNRRRENNGVPKVKATKGTVEVRPLDDFLNIWAYQAQLERDDHNTIVMTKDNNFFKGPDGKLIDPNNVGRTWVFSTALIKQQGGRWVGTYTIEEVDIFLRWDFFEQVTFQQRSVFTGLLRFGFGYQKPIWIWDINADKRTYNSSMFENANKQMWTEIAQKWDAIVYKDPLNAPAPAGYLDKAQVLPESGFIFDLADYEVPDTDPANPQPTNQTDVLFVTNLKAYDGNMKFNATFTAVYDDAAAPAKTVSEKLFTISGNAYDYPKKISINGDPTNWYPTIWLNTVKFGNGKEYDALVEAVKDHGTPKKVENASFAKALKVEVKMTGYLSEKGPKKNTKVTVYFVNSDDDK